MIKIYQIFFLIFAINFTFTIFSVNLREDLKDNILQQKEKNRLLAMQNKNTEQTHCVEIQNNKEVKVNIIKKLDNVVIRSILVRILKDIYSNVAIESFLGFKGGTAAFLFYDLPRFSVDLDFDLLNDSKEDEVFEEVKNILEQYGTVKEARKKRFNFFYLLLYTSKWHGAYNIKIEINRRKFASHYTMQTYLGISMKVMVPEDMLAHKMVAMIERLGGANRDIFDTWFFLKENWLINEKIIEERTGLSLKQFLQKCIDKLNAMSDRGILSGVGELLDEKQKVWVKKNLRSETVFLLKLRLELL